METTDESRRIDASVKKNKEEGKIDFRTSSKISKQVPLSPLYRRCQDS